MADTQMPVLLTYAEPGVLVPPNAIPVYAKLIGDFEAALIGQTCIPVRKTYPMRSGGRYLIGFAVTESLL